MLCLSRFAGESIQIGDGVTVTILSAIKGKVRVGIVAPKDVPVLRTELLTRHDAGHALDIVDHMYLETDVNGG